MTLAQHNEPAKAITALALSPARSILVEALRAEGAVPAVEGEPPEQQRPGLVFLAGHIIGEASQDGDAVMFLVTVLAGSPGTLSLRDDWAGRLPAPSGWAGER